MAPERIKVAVVYNLKGGSKFSYHVLWPKAFSDHPGMHVFRINCAWGPYRLRLAETYLRKMFRPDVVVVLHSAFANGLAIPDNLVNTIAGLDSRKIFFLTNIYKNMPQKMDFCEQIGVDVLAQLGSSKQTAEVYQKRLPGVSIAPSHAGGLDERLFTPGPPLDQRQIDIGFRGELEPFYFGHQERASIMSAVGLAANARGLVADFSMRSEDRFGPREWASFLQNCKSQLGTEGGTDFFNLEDRTRSRVNEYTTAHPGAGFDEVYRKTMAPFREAEGMRCRLITGRVIESAACKTVLMLYEGFYEGFLRADEHYIPIALDHSNLEEALDKLADPGYCARMVDASYQVVIENFTFRKLIDNVLTYL